MSSSTIMTEGRFARSINFQNEEQRRRYIADTEELARKHLALKQQWAQFASSTGAPGMLNADLEAGKILTSGPAEAFKSQQLEVERATHTYFANHEETLRAIGSGRLYQHERDIGVPMPAIARQDTPEAMGFQELLKYEIYGPTDQQKIEMATARTEQLNQKAVSDLNDLAGKYAELESSWKAVTDEMRLDGFMNPEEVTEFKHFAELQREVELATATYWEEHGWRHEQDAAAGVEPEHYVKDDLVYPDIRRADGSKVDERAQRLFRSEIAAEVAIESKVTEQGHQLNDASSVEIDLSEELAKASLAQISAPASRPESMGRGQALENLREIGAAPNFTEISEENKNWARDNAFLNEHIEANGTKDWSKLEERISSADRADRDDRVLRVGHGQTVDHQTLAERAARQTEINKAAGECKPSHSEIELGRKTTTAVRESQAAALAARQQDLARRNEYGMAA